MKYGVLVRHAAERDVAEAQDWYERQLPGLSGQFHAEFSATIETLSNTPFIYREMYRGVRRAILHRFPYLVWYRVEDSIITIIACTHGKANSAALPKRLR